MIKVISILFVTFNIVIGRDVCYLDAGLGCFTDSKPFGGIPERPVAFLPESPEKISTRFTLYNRKNGVATVIDSKNISDNFDASLKTKLIIHGFLHHDNKEWVQNMKSTILQYDNVNVITVDWSKGNGLPYTQATANTQVVGREIAKLINFLCEKTSTIAENFHLIGHSLGAHISGYAGSRLKSFYKRNLGRISGLDTAGPYFENTLPEVRLDKTDANFVDSIHTDGTPTLSVGLGMYQSVGHVDYYPNGGVNQPNCPQTSDKILNAIFSLATLDVAGVENGVACSHTASFHYFTDSIANKCKYYSYPCNTKEEFDKGSCIKCSDKGCNQMGYWSNSKSDQGRLYLNTQSPIELPYCMQSYKLTFYSDNLENLLQTRGEFKFYFITKNHQSSVEIFDNSQTTFKRDSEETRLISLSTPLEEEITDVFISFTKTSNLASSWLYWDRWSFRYIEVFSGDTQKLEKFCPYTPIIESGHTVRFSKCGI